MKHKIDSHKVKYSLLKILMLTTVLFFNSIFPVSAQLTMIQEGAVWSMLHASQQTDEVWTHHYKFVDGYEINGQVFHRLYYTNNEDLSDWMPTDMYGRQDGYMVYWDYFSYSMFSYDFSLEAGDMIYTADILDESFKMWANEVDSIPLLNGEIRKRIKMSGTDFFGYSFWIEGIGTTHGELLKPYTGMEILLCYRQGEEVLYMNDDYSVCHIFTNTKEIPKEKKAWNIHPNPTAGTVKIQSPYTPENLNNAEILIYNQLGQSVWNQPYTTQTLLLDHIPAGMYFITIKSDKYQFMPQKLVLQHP
jgi:hypothetical protein